MLNRIFFLIITIQTTFSWAMQGHSIIAAMAEKKLKSTHPEAWIKINKMLLGMQNFFPETPNTLLEAAAMSDILNFQFDGFLMSSHFRDTTIVYEKDSADDVEIPTHMPIEDVITGLNRALNVVKSSADGDYNSYIKKGFMDSLMLRYLIHLVGDIHQPLHTASFYAKNLFEGTIKFGDRGGNLIPVKDVFGKGYNDLHTLFDNAFNAFNFKKDVFPYPEDLRKNLFVQAEFLMLNYPEELFGEKTKNLQFSDWLQESFDLAHDFAYSQVELFPILGPEYIITGRRICLERMALAGYRLYHLLVMVFDKSTQKLV